MPQSVSETSLVSPITLENSEIVLQDEEEDTVLDLEQYTSPNREAVNLENAVVNVDNSSDVIIGPVTQFNVNGNVTIYQNGTGEQEASNGHITNSEYVSNGTSTDGGLKTKGDQINQWIHILYINRRSIQYLGVFLLILLVCMIIALIVIEKINKEDDDYNYNYNETYYGNKLGNHTVYYRKDWGGNVPRINTVALKHPITLVIISHSSTLTCSSLEECADLVKKIQMQHMSKPFRDSDIGYNFLIGHDGNVYVGRGWDIENFHRRKSIGISFIGDYNFDKLSADMIDAAELLINQGLELGKLSEDYILVGENQTNSKMYLSPGVNVYKVMEKNPHFYNGTML